jgi:glycogen synthase
VIDIRQHPEKGTGLFFESPTVEALANAVETFSKFQHQFNPEICRLQAAKFTPKIFATSYLAFVEDCYQRFACKILK